MHTLMAPIGDLAREILPLFEARLAAKLQRNVLVEEPINAGG